MLRNSESLGAQEQGREHWTLRMSLSVRTGTTMEAAWATDGNTEVET